VPVVMSKCERCKRFLWGKETCHCKRYMVWIYEGAEGFDEGMGWPCHGDDHDRAR